MSNVSSPLRTLVTDFRAGELDPRIRMRVDSKAYPSGAQSLNNCILSNTGAASRRPGLTRLASFAGRARLVGFEYDGDEKYILAFRDGALSIYDTEGALVQTLTSQPWDVSSMFELTVAQRGDVMFICHRGFQTRVLTRTSLTTFTIGTYSFDIARDSTERWQPYLQFQAASVTVACSSISVGTGRTLTASSSIFSSSWVGERIQIENGEVEVTAYVSATQLTVRVRKAIRRKLDPTPFSLTNGSATITVTMPLHGYSTGDTVVISGWITAYSIADSQINGSRTITVLDEDTFSFSAAASANATVQAGTNIYIGSTSATPNWMEQVFSTRRGWPGAVCFHEDRLWFGGSTDVPEGLWGSRTGRYYNFDVAEGEDDASIQVAVGGTNMGKVANIRHIVSNRLLQIFADTGEYVARQSDGSALTPSNISVRGQTAYGTSWLTPRPFDGSTLFVQSNGKTVREFIYDFNQDGLTSSDITQLSSHLINTPVSMDVLFGSTTRPEQYAFIVNGDGTVAVFHSVRSEGLAAWVPWETRSGDTFDNVLVVGPRVYFSVLRDGTYELEQLELDDPDVTLDYAVKMTGTASDTWVLGSAYANKTVHVVSNDWYLGTFAADAFGTIELDDEVEQVVAGYNFTFEIIPMSPDQAVVDGPLTGEKRRINAVNVHFYDTLSASINGKQVIGYQIGDDLSEAPARVSRKVRSFILGYDRDPAVTVAQPAPLPCTVLGMVMEVSY